MLAWIVTMRRPVGNHGLPAWKNYNHQAFSFPREWRLSASRGPIEGSSEIPKTSQHYGIEGFKWGPCIWAPIMLRDASICDSRCKFLQSGRGIPKWCTLRKLYFHFFSHWMVYDRGDSFPFYFEPNGILFGSKSKEKLSLRLYPIQIERKWNTSFLSAGFCFIHSVSVLRRSCGPIFISYNLYFFLIFGPVFIFRLKIFNFIPGLYLLYAWLFHI